MSRNVGWPIERMAKQSERHRMHNGRGATPLIGGLSAGLAAVITDSAHAQTNSAARQRLLLPEDSYATGHIYRAAGGGGGS